MLFKEFEAKNNIFMAPIKTALATPKNGLITEQLINYYERKALGGVGTVILEPISVSLSGKEHPKQLMLNSEKHEIKLKELITKLHKYGTKIVVHLNHAGRAANPKIVEDVVAPSPIKCPTTNQLPRELPKSEIRDIINDFKNAALRAQSAGADAIEIQFGHGYLVQQFYSNRLNKRTDEYGENKFLFAEQLLSSIKNSVTIPIFLRISGSEFIDDGISLKDISSIIDLAKKYDVSIIHVGWGNVCDSVPWYYNHMSLPIEPMDEILKLIKNMTNIPIISAGRMQKNERYKYLLEKHVIDGVVFGRQLIIDPDFPNKILNHSNDYIRCGSCLQGCLSSVKSGKPINCIANPEVHKTFIPKTNDKKKIAIVGGGPAGIFAGLYLKKKGYDITLFEKNNYLGGQWVMAYNAPGKLSMKDILDDLIRKAEKELKIIKNTTVDDKFFDDKDFDAIVIATGANPFVPSIKGLKKYITGFDFFSGKKVNGNKILVIGGGLIGVEVTEALVNNGKNITIVELFDEIGRGMELISKKLFSLKYLSKIKVYTNSSVEEIKENNEVFINRNGKIESIGNFDEIIVTAGTKSENSLYNTLSKKIKNVYLVGDALKVGQIFDAVNGALELAEKI
ncbi:NADH:flavin oxidoreductase [Thermosipho sp. 1063]|uniref:NAD(P)/FAD-dependent oxidoreductase n=1 Tax=unclassified Thermosipho (in: thermotogales) TaxID=2676525 RepID=UPI00094947F6|nr:MULTISPECIES: NAD(P)/FAD-dependent oxidoreductase [unclassified Thermosipho (in: thermotogales)]ANQ52942.1 NADH:flavin oxidoreductase [Thermosipho sp. 1070]APT71388.1 NADH:flavin oxidoreductase [Thermosipho sp. 1063]OOC46040.1 NADH:flavin oxidoreductase [Thermosipho sp. 1074]